MGKSSSSKRKRPSNASSSARRRKSDRIKSRRTRLKKSSRRSRRHRRHDSDSWSSGSDYDSSLSPSSDSYSSSEDNYRSRWSRSFSGKDGRKGRRRVRGDSRSFSSDEGSPPSKRRKESKRKGAGSKSRRKSGRNRYRRAARDGYSSCSTCANRSGSKDEYESHRGRSKRRENHVALRDGRSRDRSGSCSSCRHCSRSSCGQESMFSGDSRSKERVTDENNSKRLRSVIVVVNAEEREGEEDKEEIVYDKDDYPSSRSNASYDDASKKEPAHDLHDVLDVKGVLESGKGIEVVVSNLHGEPGRHGGNQQDGNHGNKRVSIGANHKDFESMLRQRALLKLQKLRGLRKSVTSHAVQEPTVAAAKEPELPREDPMRATGATSRDSSGDAAEKSGIIKEKAVYVKPGMVPTGKQSGSSSEGLAKRTVAHVPRLAVLSAVAPAFSNPWRTAYTWRRESGSSQPPAKQLISPQKHKPLRQKPLRTETNTTINAAESPQKESALNPTKKLSLSQEPKPLKMKPMAAETTNFKMELMATEITNSVSFVEESGRNELASSANSVEKLTLPEIPEPFQAKPAAADQISLSKVQQQSSLAADQSTDAKAAPGGVSSEKVVDDVKEGPKYEQKTMSVTRGGETIQVNYQVYIPKRTALARRQLKRDS